MKKITCLTMTVLCLTAGLLSGCGDSAISDEDLKAYGFEQPEGSGELLAFPGADGWGKYTKGGRGGRVIEVTNLNDSGEGSLRAAVEAEGPRTVVFKVSGVIELKDFLTIKNPYITIAGQTAPGDGICLTGYSLIVETEEAIVRYLRSRPTDEAGAETDALWVNESKQVVIDHVSASWATDETLSVSDSDKVSVQWCMISESLNHSVHSHGAHGMGSLVRGAHGQQVTYHSNLFASHRNRSPMCGNYTDASEDPEGFRFEFINNVVYNWGAKAAGKCHDVNTITHYNFISNYYLPGPESDGRLMFSEGCGVNKMYAFGNAMNGEIPADQWSLFEYEDDAENMDLKEYQQTEPFASIMTGTRSATDIFEPVVNGAGASLSRDEIDQGVVDSLWDDTGALIDDPDDAAGWSGAFPSYEQTEVPADQDHDGMADEWEKTHGLNPADPEDGAKETRLGYTNLEVYLQALITEH